MAKRAPAKTSKTTHQKLIAAIEALPDEEGWKDKVRAAIADAFRGSITAAPNKAKTRAGTNRRVAKGPRRVRRLKKY